MSPSAIPYRSIIHALRAVPVVRRGVYRDCVLTVVQTRPLDHTPGLRKKLIPLITIALDWL